MTLLRMLWTSFAYHVMFQLCGINYDPVTSNNRENTKHRVPIVREYHVHPDPILPHTRNPISLPHSGSDPLKLIGASSPAENDVSAVLLLPPITVLSEPELLPILLFKHITVAIMTTPDKTSQQSCRSY